MGAKSRKVKPRKQKAVTRASHDTEDRQPDTDFAALMRKVQTVIGERSDSRKAPVEALAEAKEKVRQVLATADDLPNRAS